MYRKMRTMRRTERLSGREEERDEGRERRKRID